MAEEQKEDTRIEKKIEPLDLDLLKRLSPLIAAAAVVVGALEFNDYHRARQEARWRAACWAPAPITPAEYHITRYPAERVFLDAGEGYRVQWTEPRTGLLREERFSTLSVCWSPLDRILLAAEDNTRFKGLKGRDDHSCALVYKDVAPGTPGYADRLEFKVASCGKQYRTDEAESQFYLEIHLPKGTDISICYPWNGRCESLTWREGSK